MPFEEYPRLFRTRHWTKLWRSNLANLQSTKDHVSNTIFVAIDTEPWLDCNGKKRDSKEASEIGLAFLFPEADAGRSSEPPRTFEETCEKFHVSSHCIRVGDRKRFTGERFWKGGEEVIPSFDPGKVEEALVNLVQTTQQQFTSSGDAPTLTLVGFDLHAEFLILSHNYPRFLRCFTSWVDVQDLAIDLATMPEAPSLQNTLIAFGYERACPTFAPPNSRGHNAGNDAMRTICALVILLFYQPRGDDLIQACRDYHSNRANQRRIEHRKRINVERSDVFRKRCPSPREKYPFQAKVDLPEATLRAPPDAEALYEYFLRFKPVAAGSNYSKIFGGWICLASLEELDAFLEAVDGLEDGQGRGRWIARSRYDPSVVPVTTKAELDEYLKQKALAEIAEKKRIRQERKQLEAQRE
ncbi:hypothetical protein A9K55_007808 [Cordyceps militaris]|uniref:Gfd2/YDR514C-like C-terminal domain-containing protein n=1 Tax=Cordyceps militaris TaxID=73501 RepID=A0A2H4SKF1_CORMI|nr:hypothetical protein A9K55_007808 [Cordyceps militaris]